MDLVISPATARTSIKSSFRKASIVRISVRACAAAACRCAGFSAAAPPPMMLSSMYLNAVARGLASWFLIASS
jgi:hypothetical protein